MGGDSLAWSRLGGSALSIRLDGETRVRAGDRLPLHLPANRLNLFDPATGVRL
jgi:hypothetical protein